MPIHHRTYAAALIFTLLLSACGRVENIVGVDLATASPTATRPPEEVALPLAQTATKEFLGTSMTMAYPSGWQTDEAGQSITLFDAQEAEGGGPGVLMFVALTRTVGLEEAQDTMAPVVMYRYLNHGREFGFVPPDAVPEEDEALAFDWQGYDAALFRWRSEDGVRTGVQIVVMDADKRRFVIISAQASTAQWPDFEPTWLNMLDTFTLNGVSLPAADVRTAYQSTAIR